MLDTLRHWWNSISIWVNTMEIGWYATIIGVLSLCCLLCLMSFIKPSYAVDKNKLKIGPLIFALIFAGLICFFVFI